MAHRTGIGTLDRKLGGGIPPGTLVAIEAPARAQREPLLCAGANLRPSMYFTTIRSEATVHKQFERAPVSEELRSIEEIRPESATGTIPEKLRGLDSGEDFIIDVVDPIEDTVDQRTYADFLNDVTETIAGADNVGYLHAYASESQTRQRQLTLDIADFVWRLLPVDDGSEINYYLEIPKTNGLQLPAKDRYLELEIGRDVYIDETRNIS